MNLESNRPQDPGALETLQNRFRDTIRCGRVGTLMPPWAEDQGGALNDFQIEQLVTLITGAQPGVDPPDDNNAVSEIGWEEARVDADHIDILEGKKLVEAIDAEDTVLVVTEPLGIFKDGLLRIGETGEDEVVLVVDSPDSSTIEENISADQTEFLVDRADQLFSQGDIVQVDGELMLVVSASEDALEVERGVQDSRARSHGIKEIVFEPFDEITVERGAFGTQAREHERGTQLFAGPIEPPTGPLIGADGVPPCGQLAPRLEEPADGEPADGAAPTPSPGQPERPPTAQEVQADFIEPTDGVIETESPDNFFTLNNFKVGVGEEVTIRLVNTGSNPHNLRIAGLDGEWSSDDDFTTDLLSNGQTDEFTFSLDEEATLVFRCDVHPLEMWGQITVE